MWFRQDLRVKDNPALISAADSGKVIPIYIHDEAIPQKAVQGAASKWWLHHALKELNSDLEGHLRLYRGPAQEILLELCDKLNVKEVFCNRMYEPWARKRDKDIESALNKGDISVNITNGRLLWEPWQVLKEDDTPYKVFTPFYKNGCLSAPSPRLPERKPQIQFLESSTHIKHSCGLSELGLLPTANWDEGVASKWTVTEQSAQYKLKRFIDDAIETYDNARDIPSINGTSRLSPYLNSGMLSPNQVWHAIYNACDGNTDQQGIATFLSELGWREFSYSLLYHFDDIQKRNFKPKFNDFAWRQDKRALEAWKQGKTGIPIVDAGMRELYQTGYMHNRARMITASFLVKNLLIDWREGERWFWDCLVDADAASNSAGWQWVAGTGADASPYFRIFNPVTQGERFDKDGEYVKQYCPELRALSIKYIHKPWQASEHVLTAAGIKLGQEYPKPIVDLKETRQRALDAYECIK